MDENKMKEIASELSQLTGKFWTFHPATKQAPYYNPSIACNDDDGTQLVIGIHQISQTTAEERSGKPVKLEVEGLIHYPTPSGNYKSLHNFLDKSGREATRSICVSDSKTAVQIARDINRRLIPEWVPAFGDAIEAFKKFLESERQRSEVCLRLAAILGDNPRGHDSEYGITTYDRFYSNNKSVRQIEVYNSLSIKIELTTISLDKAEKLLKLIAELEQPATTLSKQQQ